MKSTRSWTGWPRASRWGSWARAPIAPGNPTLNVHITFLVHKHAFYAIAAQTVSGKLSRHVMKKRDQLIQGINTVATVEDDMKAALATTRTSRAAMKQAAEEVQRHLRVAKQTKRKQSYMQLLEVVVKVKAAKDLQKSLRRVSRAGLGAGSSFATLSGACAAHACCAWQVPILHAMCMCMALVACLC